MSRENKSDSNQKLRLPDPSETYFKYMVVRHPLERLVSAFIHKFRKGITLPKKNSSSKGKVHAHNAIKNKYHNIHISLMLAKKIYF